MQSIKNKFKSKKDRFQTPKKCKRIYSKIDSTSLKEFSKTKRWNLQKTTQEQELNLAFIPDTPLHLGNVQSTQKLLIKTFKKEVHNQVEWILNFYKVGMKFKFLAQVTRIK